MLSCRPLEWCSKQSEQLVCEHSIQGLEYVGGDLAAWGILSAISSLWVAEKSWGSGSGVKKVEILLFNADNLSSFKATEAFKCIKCCVYLPDSICLLKLLLFIPRWNRIKVIELHSIYHTLYKERRLKLRFPDFYQHIMSQSQRRGRGLTHCSTLGPLSELPSPDMSYFTSLFV